MKINKGIFRETKVELINHQQDFTTINIEAKINKSL